MRCAGRSEVSAIEAVIPKGTNGERGELAGVCTQKDRSTYVVRRCTFQSGCKFTVHIEKCDDRQNTDACNKTVSPTPSSRYNQIAHTTPDKKY